jgi:hypothetical protein
VVDTAQPRSVQRTIDNYTPQIVTPEMWQRIGPTLRSLLHTYGYGSSHSARTELPMHTAYVAWTVVEGHWQPEQGGWPPYTPALIENYCARQVAGTVKTRGKTRSALRRLGRMIAPDRWADPSAAYATSEVLPPYTAVELDTMVRHATDLRTLTGNAAPLAVITVGRGAGLHAPDYRATWATDVHTIDGVPVVDVGPPRPRRVPLHRDWADLALDAAASLDGRLLSGGISTTRHNLVSKTAERFNQGCSVRLHATRLRHTWMLALLDDGVPVDVIAQAAGISHLHTIERLLDRIALRPAEQTVAWLTGGGR